MSSGWAVLTAGPLSSFTAAAAIRSCYETTPLLVPFFSRTGWRPPACGLSGGGRGGRSDAGATAAAGNDAKRLSAAAGQPTDIALLPPLQMPWDLA